MWWLYGVGWLGLGLLVLPQASLLWESPWGEIGAIITGPQALSALRVSLVVSGAATSLALFLGLPLAVLLHKVQAPWSSLGRGVIVLPLVLPPVATGVGLLTAFGQRGLTGRLFGIGLANTTVGAILAATVVSLPFAVLTVEGGLRATDTQFGAVAASLGASPAQRLFRIHLPLARRSVAAATVMTWARALGEFGATITFAGSIEGVTRTLPLQIALALEQDQEQALTLSVLLILVSLGVMVSLGATRVGPTTYRSEGGV